MRVDTFAPQADLATIEAAARRAEQLGFDAFCAPEIAVDPFIALACAARATERIQLRTAIAVAFPRSPMITAGSAWTIHANSGGRFVLGLGTQVKGHNERRFSVPWVAPRERLREYVDSLRAIWRCWEHGEPLRYKGAHYAFTLMTPEFSPPPTGFPLIPVFLAAVRPKMLELAGAVADGVRLHGFCTRRYMEQTVLPALDAGLAASGRTRADLEICGGGFIATGPDDAAVARRLEWVRYRVAFYGSTRTYQPVMSAHGWDDLAGKLHRMSLRGRWEEMAREVPDDVVHAFCAAAPYDRIAAEIQRRFGGISDTIELPLPDDPAEDATLRDLLQDIRR